MSRALISLNIETFDIFDQACIQELKTAKIIRIMSQNSNLLERNLYGLFKHSLRLRMIYLSDYRDANQLKCVFRNSYTENIILIIDICLSRVHESELDNLELQFAKIIYVCDLNYLNQLSIFLGQTDLIFLGHCDCMTQHERNMIYDYCLIQINKNREVTQPDRKRLSSVHNICTGTNDILMIKTDAFKICKLDEEKMITYGYRPLLPDDILVCIKYIADGKSIFHDKHGHTYKLFWRRYYFLTKWKDIYPNLVSLIQNLNTTTYSKDVLVIIFRFMSELIEKERI